jgi:CheY-like chemotaxis protein
MVYGFATQSRGGLQIDSRPGQGTRVTLYLPTAAAAAMAGRESTSVAGEPMRGTGLILVVEDDAEVRDVSVEILQRLGYRTLVARDGRAALDLLRQADDIDLLFTDIVMPGGMSGVALARQAQAVRPDLPVLLTTGYAGAAGPSADEFPVILKPFRSADLGSAVRKVIRQAA